MAEINSSVYSGTVAVAEAKDAGEKKLFEFDMLFHKRKSDLIEVKTRVENHKYDEAVDEENRKNQGGFLGAIGDGIEFVGSLFGL